LTKLEVKIRRRERESRENLFGELISDIRRDTSFFKVIQNEVVGESISVFKVRAGFHKGKIDEMGIEFLLLRKFYLGDPVILLDKLFGLTQLILF